MYIYIYIYIGTCGLHVPSPILVHSQPTAQSSPRSFSLALSLYIYICLCIYTSTSESIYDFLLTCGLHVPSPILVHSQPTAQSSPRSAWPLPGTASKKEASTPYTIMWKTTTRGARSIKHHICMYIYICIHVHLSIYMYMCECLCV